ncbi:hypothetical protein L226DRAFT_573212 [Lentinus tigrinus ALCF2SS1-7]|uniref:uncharacterized protein n=1 Tax=Lentinus tigrinus ALCF2SS1-7 TaxID=1328758 RepID=UPI0011663A4C|nr:hypothetical protein L226DRAFT_573212 [Lentinus tigrinus ALCF2SS1-7]
MNAFWDFVDWILPPVRIIDDLAGPPEPIHRSRSSHHHHSPRKDHDKDRERERSSGARRDKERERERAKPKEGRLSEHEREREQLRQRIQHLERENESLLEQLRATREELSTLSAAAFPPPSSSDRTPQSLSYPASPPDPASIALPVSRTHSRASSEASSSQTPIQTRVAQHSAEAALADPKRLRVLYTSLRATYGDARQTILSQAEELASLKSFLSKTDDWSGAQLLQALADLNAEILQLAASIADEFAPSLRADTRAPSAAKERDREIVGPALGKEMLKLLEEREHAGDPTLVQFALQAWEVWCVSRVMDAFCYGLPIEVDEALRLIFERMQREEPQPTTSRWRALTYKHARSLLARPRMSSEPSSPDTITPSPFNSAPASIVSTSSLPPPLLTLTEANLRGILAILALSGCTDARGLHRDPLRSRFGSALSRISARAERISSVVKEGVLSGLFEVAWVPPCRSPRTSSSRRASAAAATETPASPGANRGKGKEREWVQEVERAQSGESQTETEEHWFDWNSMENVYAGYCSEQCRVLCTVELGLVFERRLPEEEKEESVDGDGMVTGSSAARPVAMGGVGVNGVVSGSVSVSVSRSTSAGSASDATSEGTKVVRNLLLKPKVLLESVVDIL